jgi:hypothetical protein
MKNAVKRQCAEHAGLIVRREADLCTSQRCSIVSRGNDAERVACPYRAAVEVTDDLYGVPQSPWPHAPRRRGLAFWYHLMRLVSVLVYSNACCGVQPGTRHWGGGTTSVVSHSLAGCA